MPSRLLVHPGRVPFRIAKSLVAVVTAAVLISLSACGGDSDDGGGADGSVRVAYAPTSAWLPVVVADEQGIFAEHGLDVDLTEVQNLDTTVGALGRQFEIIGQSPIALALASARGVDVGVISGNTLETEDNQQAAVLVAADSPIQDFADLADASVGTPSLSGPLHVATIAAITAAGADPAGLRGVEMGFPTMGDSLQAGTVDAVEHVQPFAGGLVASGQARSVGDPLMVVSDGETIPFTLWASSGSWADEHPEQVQAWRDSLTEAAEYIDANPDEARATLQEMTGLPAEVVSALVLPEFDTELATEQLDVWIEISKAAGLDVGDVDGAALMVEP